MNGNRRRSDRYSRGAQRHVIVRLDAWPDRTIDVVDTMHIALDRRIRETVRRARSVSRRSTRGNARADRSPIFGAGGHLRLPDALVVRAAKLLRSTMRRSRSPSE